MRAIHLGPVKGKSYSPIAQRGFPWFSRPMLQVQERSSRGGCPRCGKTVPFLEATLRRGRPFRCKECASSLVIAKMAVNVGIAAFTAVSFLSRRIPVTVIALLVAGAAIAEWLLAKVQLADEPVSSSEEGAASL